MVSWKVEQSTSNHLPSATFHPFNPEVWKHLNRGESCQPSSPQVLKSPNLVERLGEFFEQENA